MQAAGGHAVAESVLFDEDGGGLSLAGEQGGGGDQQAVSEFVVHHDSCKSG
jgi:hypothetical protein